MTPAKLRLGTRGSALARWQADWAAGQLRALGVAVQIVPIATRGDIRSGPIGQIEPAGGRGVFTKEIQQALADQTIDVAVHSLKDLPTEPVEGLILAAVPPRESPSDVLVSPTARTLDDLPHAAVVGTGSLRRRAQLLAARGDLRIEAVRGNVDTRLRKLEQGRYDALVLAQAGLSRLGLAEQISWPIPHNIMLPAVGQGALALETRADDDATRRIVVQLDDAATRQAVLSERALLATLRGGCLAPVGAWGRVGEDRLLLDAIVLSPDGRQRLTARGSDVIGRGQVLGCHVAQQLLDQGAAELLAAARDRQ